MKIGKKNSLSSKKNILLHWSALKMSPSWSGDLCAQFKHPFRILPLIEAEIILKMLWLCNFTEKTVKKHKRPGRDL